MPFKLRGTQVALRDPNIGVVLNDRYRIEAVLGRGGFGTVYRGLHLDLDRPVAIKILVGTGEDESTHRRRFRQEAQVLDQLRHPSIVRLKDFGEADGLVFMVQEFVEGPTLEAQVHESGPLSPEAAVTVLADVLDGLAEAHAAGVVHRDVKPANIMLPEPHRGRLLDFGIAALLGQVRKTRTGLLIGTPEYMAPEYIRGGRPEPAGDLYAVGGVLYFALTGQGPFALDPGASPHAQLLAQIERPAPRLPPGLPPGLQSILDRALAKAPDARFPGASSMSEALRGALGGAVVADRITPTMGSRVVGLPSGRAGDPTQVLFSMPPADSPAVSGHVGIDDIEPSAESAPEAQPDVRSDPGCDSSGCGSSDGASDQPTPQSVIVASTILLDGEAPEAPDSECQMEPAATGPRGTRVYGGESASDEARLPATIMTADPGHLGPVEGAPGPPGGTAQLPAPDMVVRANGKPAPDVRRAVDETDLAFARLEPPDRARRARRYSGVSLAVLALIVSLGAALGLLAYAVVPDAPRVVHTHRGGAGDAGATSTSHPATSVSMTVEPHGSSATSSTGPEPERAPVTTWEFEPPALLARPVAIGVPPLLARLEQITAPRKTRSRRSSQRARRPEDPWDALDAFFDALARGDCADARRHGRAALRARKGRPDAASLSTPYSRACRKAPPLLERR